LAGELGHAIEHRCDAPFDGDALAGELGKEREVPLASDEHARARDRVDGAAREALASVVADADDVDRGFHDASVERSRSACRMATAMGLPPLRPSATMNGVERRAAAAFDSAA